VHELGHVADPAATMAGADVLVLPSVEEGSALVTYEARGSGCVLAVSDRSGAMCRDGHDGLVHAAGDVETLRDHIRALGSDPGLLARMRAASLSGMDDLTWSAAAHRLLEAYGAGMGLPRRGTAASRAA
jgi:glycosyltransferase involved in cell wall biosynthesis